MRTWVTGIIALAMITATACIDVTPSSERDQTVVLTPTALRAGMQLALAGFQDLQTRITYRASYGSDAELARRASNGEAAIVLTLHPAWADYIADRGSVAERASIGLDRLVLVGSPAGTGATIADPSELLSLNGAIGIPSTEAEAAGMYTRETLVRYGIWSQLEPRLTVFPGASDAITALRDGRIAYAFTLGSDAIEEGLPIVLALDDAFHQPVLVEALLLDTTSPSARQLFDYLVGPQGQGAFSSKGLRPAR